MQEALRGREVLADRIFGNRSIVKHVVLIMGGSLVVALTAQLTVPLWPVPITGQTFGVLLVGATLGSRRGMAALILYLAEGAAGLPVFAGGSFGPMALVGATGGYLWGFVLAAGLIGWLMERGWDRSVGKAALALSLGNLVIYLIGLPWLALFVGWSKLLMVGLIPFVPGDVLKLVISTLALSSTRKWVS